jgi:hypothetical protein
MLKKLKKRTSSEFLTEFLMHAVIPSALYLFCNDLVSYLVMDLLDSKCSMKSERHQCRC